MTQQQVFFIGTKGSGVGNVQVLYAEADGMSIWMVATENAILWRVWHGFGLTAPGQLRRSIISTAIRQMIA